MSAFVTTKEALKVCRAYARQHGYTFSRSPQRVSGRPVVYAMADSINHQIDYDTLRGWADRIANRGNPAPFGN
jgi:hypothetical protein